MCKNKFKCKYTYNNIIKRKWDYSPRSIFSKKFIEIWKRKHLKSSLYKHP